MKLHRGHRTREDTVWATDDREAAAEYADHNGGTVHTVTVDRDDVAPKSWLADHGFAAEWTDTCEIDGQLPEIIAALIADGYRAARGVVDHTPMLTQHESFIVAPE